MCARCYIPMYVGIYTVYVARCSLFPQAIGRGSVHVRTTHTFCSLTVGKIQATHTHTVNMSSKDLVQHNITPVSNRAAYSSPNLYASAFQTSYNASNKVPRNTNTLTVPE